jgi:hypothetical protein
VVEIELTPHILNEPAQAVVGAVDQRHQPRLGALAARALAVPDVELADPAQLPAHIVQVEHPGLVDPQTYVGGQPGDGVVARGRAELATAGQLCSPPSEQRLDLDLGRRDPRLRVDRGSRPVHLIQRAFDHATGEVVQLDGMAQGEKLEEHRERARSTGPGRRPGLAEHLAEVGIRVGGCISHNGRSNQSRISSRWLVSLRMVLSANPAEARASTNPASRSVSKSAISSSVVSARCSRRSRTTASANPHHLTSLRMRN